MKLMSIDPEVIPSSSSAGVNAVRSIPRWFVYAAIGLGALVLIGILKFLLPLMVMGLVLAFIWKQATTN
tara:strand:- start:328 stop:534 length:207 start_codon:yes stop_codon:yes gene_type:complete